MGDRKPGALADQLHHKDGLAPVEHRQVIGETFITATVASRITKHKQKSPLSRVDNSCPQSAKPGYGRHQKRGKAI
ncbi:MAG: hypothetical protein QOH47_2514 [Sphingomonadales bacterium]|jgi:hypothetical protein|nr:hypothetical protein [Sphingomonadales bacterium]